MEKIKREQIQKAHFDEVETYFTELFSDLLRKAEDRVITEKIKEFGANFFNSYDPFYPPSLHMAAYPLSELSEIFTGKIKDDFKREFHEWRYNDKNLAYEIKRGVLGKLLNDVRDEIVTEDN